MCRGTAQVVAWSAVTFMLLTDCQIIIEAEMCQDQFVKVSDILLSLHRLQCCPSRSCCLRPHLGKGLGRPVPPLPALGPPPPTGPCPGAWSSWAWCCAIAGQSAPALNGLDLDVPGGSKIGVCGRTGKLPVNFFCALTRMAGTRAASASPHYRLYIASSCGSTDGSWTSPHHSHCYARTQCSLADEHADLNDFKRSCSPPHQ